MERLRGGYCAGGDGRQSLPMRPARMGRTNRLVNAAAISQYRSN